MKMVHFVLPTLFAGVLVALGLGCKPSGPAAPTEVNAKFVSVSKNSFNEVTSQLDPGGSFYVYLSTAQWLSGLSTNVATWQASFDNLAPAMNTDRANIDNVFGIATRLIKDSGIEDASGVGMSSVEIEPGFYRNKSLLHHYPGQGQGFLWNLTGHSPHPLDGLNLLPANTALAIFSDADVPLLWSVVSNGAAQSGFPVAQTALQTFPTLFEQQTQIKWDQLLNSLGGEIGILLTLNESNRLTLPIPTAAFEIPEPGLAVVLKVKDDTLFNRIDQELKKNPLAVSVDKPGLKMRTMPIPLPLPITLRPTAASTGGYLLIGSTDQLIDEMVAVQRGDKPGLKSTEEFKHLSRNLPDKGNQFSFVSERFSRAARGIQSQAMTAANARDKSAAQTQWLQNLLSQGQSMCSYSVEANTENGCVVVANGTQNGANAALLPAVAVTGMLAAIAIPNFVKARATSQENACLNNLRLIDAAKNQWALLNHKDGNAVPTEEDLKPFLKKWPTCPAGGTYTIGAVNEKPTCSIPDHRLP
jgi:hypothetical protein